MKMHINLVGTNGDMIFFRVLDSDDNVAYRTNSRGEGLWKLDKCDWRQVVGTSQFHLHQKTNSGKRKAIIRLFEYGNETFR